MNVRKGLPVLVAVLVGVVTLIGLLMGDGLLAQAGDLLLQWAGFLAAFALLLGVLNLLLVHLGRLAQGSGYSAILVLSLLAVLGLGLTDLLGITEAGVALAFAWVQAPLEAALASLLAFFLLFAGFQLLKRQQTIGAALFAGTAIFLLSSRVLVTLPLLPENVGRVLAQANTWIDQIIVTAGMRGLLIGIALGTITLSLRLLAGIEQPYNR